MRSPASARVGLVGFEFVASSECCQSIDDLRGLQRDDADADRWFFFGVALVVAGFALVVVKIARSFSTLWLLRSQMLAFVIACMLYGLFPVDCVMHRYNVSRIASGYLHPSVMVAVKPCSQEGITPLLGLTDVSDPIIREGVLAMLAAHQRSIEQNTVRTPWTWHRFQASANVAYAELAEKQSLWAEYLDDEAARAAAIKRFKAYAMQWY